MVTRPARLGPKNTPGNHETMTVKKIGRRVPLKLFFYVHWILRKKAVEEALLLVHPNAGFDLMWPKNGGFPLLSNAAAAHTDCLLQ